MRKVLTTGSFLVFGLLGLSYIFIFFGTPTELMKKSVRISTHESQKIELLLRWWLKVKSCFSGRQMSVLFVEVREEPES